MKKILASFALLVAASALAAGLGPWYTSRVANRQIATLVRALNRPGVLEAHYRRDTSNWFGQNGTLTLMRLGQIRANSPREIVLKLAVAYGPIPFADWQRGRVRLMPVGAVIDTRVQGLGKALRKAGSDYTLRDIVALNGDNTLDFSLKPGNFTAPGGTRLQWTSAALHLQQKNGGSLSGRGHTGTFTVTGPATGRVRLRISPARLAIERLRYLHGQTAGRLSLAWDGLGAELPNRRSGVTTSLAMGRMEFAMDSHFVRGIVAGKAELRLAGLEIREPAGAPRPVFAFSNMVLGSSTAEPKDGFTRSTMHWAVGDVELRGQRYARGVIELRLKHLYVPAMVEILKVMRSANHTVRAQAGTPPALIFQRMAGILSPPLQSLLEHRPVLRLAQLRLDTPGGTLQGNGSARIAPANGATPSLATLPQDLAANLSMRIPGPLAQQLVALTLAHQGIPSDQLASASRQFLDKLQGRGLVRRQGDAYTLQLSYRDSMLRVNGEPVWQG